MNLQEAVSRMRSREEADRLEREHRARLQWEENHAGERALLADHQHSTWSDWMRWMFEQGTMNPNGSWTMPADLVQRWQRQMNTPYDDLPENEKVNDIKLADEIIGITG